MGDMEIVVFPMALAKMIQHTSANIHKEVAGFLIGKIPDENTVQITDVAVARQKGTSVHVTLKDEDQALIAERLEKEELGEVIVGWYHSHPRMGAHFFSATDVSTQKRYQFFLSHAVGIVLDPYKYVMSGAVQDMDVHAWRVDETGYANDVPFTVLKDNNQSILNILEHLKRQKVLEQAVSEIIYSLNPKLEQSVSELLGTTVDGSLAGGGVLNFRKVILLSMMIQGLLIIGIFCIIWAIIILTL